MDTLTNCHKTFFHILFCFRTFCISFSFLKKEKNNADWECALPPPSWTDQSNFFYAFPNMKGVPI